MSMQQNGINIFGIFVSRSFMAWVFVGLIAGWLTGKLTRGRGFGCLADVLIGMVGAFIGGWVFMKFGISGGGLLFSIAAATVGAVLLVAIAHLLSGGRD